MVFLNKKMSGGTPFRMPSTKRPLPFNLPHTAANDNYHLPVNDNKIRRLRLGKLFNLGLIAFGAKYIYDKYFAAGSGYHLDSQWILYHTCPSGGNEDVWKRIGPSSSESCAVLQAGGEPLGSPIPDYAVWIHTGAQYEIGGTMRYDVVNVYHRPVSGPTSWVKSDPVILDNPFENSIGVLKHVSPIDVAPFDISRPVELPFKSLPFRDALQKGVLQSPEGSSRGYQLPDAPRKNSRNPREVETLVPTIEMTLGKTTFKPDAKHVLEPNLRPNVVEKKVVADGNNFIIAFSPAIKKLLGAKEAISEGYDFMLALNKALPRRLQARGALLKPQNLAQHLWRYRDDIDYAQAIMNVYEQNNLDRWYYKTTIGPRKRLAKRGLRANFKTGV